jgi:nucleotide-binding universal stress UspA family protein
MTDSAGKILLAVDGSEEAGLAAQAAVELCEKTGSELHVVHVGRGTRHVGDTGPVLLDPRTEELAQERLDQQAQALLDAEVQKIEGLGGSVSRSHLLREHPADQIVRLAEELEARMVVMGSRGRGGIRRALMGSVSEDVVRHAHCPVFVARKFGGETLLPARIVLAVDGSPESDAAASIAAELANSADSELYLVHVAPNTHLPYEHWYLAENVESYLEQAKKEARTFLEGQAERLRAGTEAQVHASLRLGSPETAIVEFADEVDAGMVILGSRGLGGIRRALMGGVSDSVVRHARCPVLVVRREKAEGQEPGTVEGRARDRT